MLHNYNNSTDPVLRVFLKTGHFNLDILLFSLEKHAENKVDSFRRGEGTEVTGTGSPGHVYNMYPVSARHAVRTNKQLAAAYDPSVVRRNKQTNAQSNTVEQRKCIVRTH